MIDDELNSLVEATIERIMISRADCRLEILANSPWGKKEQKLIVAKGIDHLLIQDAILYNIIYGVTLFNASDFQSYESEAAKRLFLLMRGRDPIESDSEWYLLDAKLSLLRDGTRTLMEIEPVCGASILVLAMDICIESVMPAGGPGLDSETGAASTI